MSRNIESRCCVSGTNTVLEVNCNSKLKILIEKKIREVEVKGKEIRRRWSKVQSSSYKIHIGDVMYNAINIINTAISYV